MIHYAIIYSLWKILDITIFRMGGISWVWNTEKEVTSSFDIEQYKIKEIA